MIDETQDQEFKQIHDCNDIKVTNHELMLDTTQHDHIGHIQDNNDVHLFDQKPMLDETLFKLSFGGKTYKKSKSSNEISVSQFNSENVE